MSNLLKRIEQLIRHTHAKRQTPLESLNDILTPGGWENATWKLAKPTTRRNLRRLNDAFETFNGRRYNYSGAELGEIVLQLQKLLILIDDYHWSNEQRSWNFLFNGLGLVRLIRFESFAIDKIECIRNDQAC